VRPSSVRSFEMTAAALCFLPSVNSDLRAGRRMGTDSSVGEKPPFSTLLTFEMGLWKVAMDSGAVTGTVSGPTELS